MKARREGDMLRFDCPACAQAVLVWGDGEEHPAIPYHEVNVGPDGWSFNGSLERPKLSPSVRTRYGEKLDYTCHFFVRDGRIEYCSDSTHALAGKVMELPDLKAEGE